jgi:hypothetical protein
MSQWLATADAGASALETGPQPRAAAIAAVAEFGLDADRRAARPPRLRHAADAELVADRLLDPEVPELAGELVGRALRPDAPDHVERLQHHAMALVGVGNIEQLVVRRQAAGADAENEAPAAHVIELRGLGRDDGGMAVRQVDDAGGEHDAAGLRDEARHEHHRGRDRLAGGGEVLADPQFVEAEALGQQGFLRGLLEIRAKRPRRRMQRHHEQAKAHVGLRSDNGLCGGS